MKPIFITGIGTDVGKTLIASVVTEALQADYWKPVQAGFQHGTDVEWVRSMVSNSLSTIHDELYRLHTPASPHIAARKDSLQIDLPLICAQARLLQQLAGNRRLVIEGAGGLLVPLTDELMVADLVAQLDATVILVSRNYLGSINHSLLTADVCKNRNLDVAGWIFNDDYLAYEQEIVNWSGFASLGAVPHLDQIDQAIVAAIAAALRPALLQKFPVS